MLSSATVINAWQDSASGEVDGSDSWPLPSPAKSGRDSVYPKVPQFTPNRNGSGGVEAVNSCLGFPFPAVPEPVEHRRSSAKSRFSITLGDMSAPSSCIPPPVRFRNPFEDSKVVFSDPFQPALPPACHSPAAAKLSRPSIPVEDKDHFLRHFEEPLKKDSIVSNPFRDPPLPVIPVPTGNSSPLTSYTPSIVSENQLLDEEKQEVYRAHAIEDPEKVSIAEPKTTVAEEFIVLRPAQIGKWQHRNAQSGCCPACRWSG